LSGVSGTGKSALPRLIAEATSAQFTAAPVKPDWTDSAEVIGYTRLNGEFVPGVLLDAAAKATGSPEKQHFLLLDEMNIARVEYYFAEALSILEMRVGGLHGASDFPVAPHSPPPWNGYGWPSNLCVVGSVNIDETTFAFSRKVLDRAFVIEFNNVDLSEFSTISESKSPETWTSSDWFTATPSTVAYEHHDDERIQEALGILIDLNAYLERMRLNFGFRVRDEILAFLVRSQEVEDAFVDENQGAIDPLDLAIFSKVLPRLNGSGSEFRSLLVTLMDWSSGRGTLAAPTGRPLPLCRDRIESLTNQLSQTGFATFWD